MPVGSGMGSSASSSAAAAAAIFAILDLKAKDDTLFECLKIGEETASGSGHLDNVIPSYFGGFYVICEDSYKSTSTCQRRYLRIEGGDRVMSVVVRPEISVKTSRSREAVKDYVRKVYLDSVSAKATDILRLLREESAKAAQMVHAVMTNNVQMMGELLNKNNMLEAARSRFIPHFDEVKASALRAGAYGCTISGSGPAMVAITDSQDKANHIRDAMVAAFDGLAPRWLISPIGNKGVRIVDSIEQFIMRSISHHSFWDFPESRR
jgi:homoserine kinase